MSVYFQHYGVATRAGTLQVSLPQITAAPLVSRAPPASSLPQLAPPPPPGPGSLPSIEPAPPPPPGSGDGDVPFIEPFTDTILEGPPLPPPPLVSADPYTAASYPSSVLPWVIGGGALLLVGVGAFVYVRKHKSKSVSGYRRRKRARR